MVCVCVTRMKMRVMMMIIMTEYFETDCRQQVKSSQYKYKYFHARVHTLLGGKKNCKRLVLRDIKRFGTISFSTFEEMSSWQWAVNKSKAITRWRCWWSITSLPVADLAMRRELTRVRLELNYGVNNRWLSWPGSPRYLWDASRVDGCYEFLCCVLIEKII